MNRIVLIGIGGIGMSAVARVLVELGFSNLIGIDSSSSEITESLRTLGINIVPHGKTVMSPDDFVVYSAAANNCIELQDYAPFFDQYPKKGSVPLTYFQFLGEISKYFSTIAIAGTHGKSTTSGLTAQTLSRHHQDFGLSIVGAGIADWEGNNMVINQEHKTDIRDILHHIISPKGPGVEQLHKKYLFVVEACEYNKQFLSLDVDYAGITNIELDHVDVYGNIETYFETFLLFTSKVHKKIFFLEGLYGTEELLLQDNTGCSLIQKETFEFDHLLGSHNHLNASLALGICEHMCARPSEGLVTQKDTIKQSLNEFGGLRRRGETLGRNTHGVQIITDYGHHPTELASTLEALEELTEREHITCIFQPHQARRITEFRDEFIGVCKSVQDPLIFNLYTAREQIEDLPDYTVNSSSLKQVVDSLSSFDELGTLFAKESEGTYTTDIQEIFKKITSVTTGVIIIFTAGNLDWEVRKWIES